MTLWKKTEREIAKLIGGRRVPVTGRQRGDVPDIEHPLLSIEVKERQTLPAWVEEAMSQAEASVKPFQIPVVFLHPKGGKHMDDLTILRLRDMIWILEELKRKEEA